MRGYTTTIGDEGRTLRSGAECYDKPFKFTFLAPHQCWHNQRIFRKCLDLSQQNQKTRKYGKI